MTEIPLHFEPPRGMRDFYPEDMAARNAVFAAWAEAARRFGFVQYDACVVESLELLKRKSGEEIGDQLYTFKDKSDRDLALRPEMTPTLARMIAARHGMLSFPLKWFAIAQCFRYERTTKGRKREHYQWNLDILGEESLSAEAEILACVFSALTALGLNAQDVRTHFSSRALLADLLAKAGISEEHHSAAFLALDKRGKIPDDEIVLLLRKAGLKQEDVAAAFRIMALNDLDDVRSFLGGETPALAAAAELPRRMADYGLDDYLCFDIGVVRGLGYYTGIVFEAYAAAHKMRAIFGGGRYDRLLGELGGNALSGVGLGFGDVVIMDLLQAKGGMPSGPDRIDLAVGFMEEAQRPAAVRLARVWREEGRRADLALHCEKAKNFFGRVGKGGVTEAVFLGPDDLASGTARVKNLSGRTERQIPLK
ncbi:MAG: histidine--tRNA ligase [Kiritimatiellae bacterium]|nr:histidine--tRNA ligase [Kiritimatiellia bacterium]